MHIWYARICKYSWSRKPTNCRHHADLKDAPPRCSRMFEKANSIGREDEKRREIAIVPKLSSIVSPCSGRLLAGSICLRWSSGEWRNEALRPLLYVCLLLDRGPYLVHQAPEASSHRLFPRWVSSSRSRRSPRRCSHLQQFLREGNDGSVQLSRGSTTRSDRFTPRRNKKKKKKKRKTEWNPSGGSFVSYGVR